MEELLGLGELEEALYESWSAAGYGMIITGPYPLPLHEFCECHSNSKGAHAGGLQETCKSRRITSDSRSTLPFRVQQEMSILLALPLLLLLSAQASPAGQRPANLLARTLLQDRRRRSPSCS